MCHRHRVHCHHVLTCTQLLPVVVHFYWALHGATAQSVDKPCKQAIMSHVATAKVLVYSCFSRGSLPCCYAMLCYAMLCYAMLCYAMLRYAMLCYAMLRYATLCYATLCYATLCYAMLCCAGQTGPGLYYMHLAGELSLASSCACCSAYLGLSSAKSARGLEASGACLDIVVSGRIG